MYENYARIRDSKGLKDSDVSKGAGIPHSILSDWKKGRYNIKADKLKKIAEFLGVSVDYLMKGNDTFPEDAPSYYFDEEAREAARFLHDNPQYKVLFQASQKVRPEDIGFIKEMIERASK